MAADAVRRLDSREVYTNPWLSLREDRVVRADGAVGIYSVVDKPDFAVVIPIGDDGVHLVEQFRYPVGRRSLEFPQGSIGRDAEPLQIARTELAEETGLRAGRWTHLARLWSAVGFCAQSYDVFVARELTRGEPAREAEEQDLVEVVLSRAELEAALDDGRIRDGHTVAAYGLLLRHELRVARAR